MKCGSFREIIQKPKKLFKERSHDEIKHDSEKKARGAFEQSLGKEELVNRMFQIIKTGKQGLNGFIQELGTLLVEAIINMERGRSVQGLSISHSMKECISGPIKRVLCICDSP